MNHFVKPIRSESDLDAAIERLNILFGSPVGSPDGDELEILLVLVSDYENRHHPILPTEPLEAIKCRMEDLGLKQKDLVPAIGHPGTVSEVLNGKRSLTVKMIRNLSELLRLPAEALLGKDSAA